MATWNAKKIIRRLLSHVGYKIYRIERPPFGAGVDLSFDIRKILPYHRFEVVFDVGANVGRTVKRFRSVFSEAMIYSFEPVSSTYRELCNNVKGLKGVHTYPIAFGDYQGETKIVLQHSSGWNTLVPQINTKYSLSGSHQEVVKVETIDQFCVDNGIDHIDLLKTDTEGFDMCVLAGAKQLLTNNKILAVFSEVDFKEDNPGHTSFIRLLHFLQPFGFEFFALYDLAFIRSQPYRLNYANALFLNIHHNCWQKALSERNESC